MDPLRVLTRTDGFFTRQEAKSAGYGDRDITRAVRQRTWVRFRRGSYAFADEWAALDPVGRHAVRARAVLRSLGDAVVLSHVSGLVGFGIDVWGVNLDRIHVTRIDGGPGRIERDVVHHEGAAVDSDIIDVGPHRILRPERCALEAASRTSNEKALCLLEAGLRAGAYDAARLTEQYHRMQQWPFMQHLRIPVGMADPLSGSVGESRGRWHFRILGLPAPESQFAVHGPGGILVGTADWHWERQRLLGEFDGRMKYGRLLKPGQEPGDVVFAEKRREDELRELTGCAVLRLVWSDFEHPSLIAERFWRLARQAG